jgi:hypothetical protein
MSRRTWQEAFTPAHVAPVEAIRRVGWAAGLRLQWSMADPAGRHMHIQIDVSPAELAGGIAPP